MKQGKQLEATMEKRKYPIGPEHYTIYEEIGQGVSASVYRALCNPLDEIVAIKILDFERDNCDLNNVSREAQTMVLVDHPNVLRSHCSFVDDHNLWVVMPFMSGGSCLHILKAAHTDGFGETVIATILREVLKGLEYLHHHGHIHRDVKAGNILVDSKGAIKLGDFGVCACLFDSGDRQKSRNTFVGTPCWMAPEVMEQTNGYDFKADIWSFGITALELANGHAPFSKYPPMKVLLMTIQNAPPGLENDKGKKYTKSFKQMIASCLVKEPSKRPSAKKLLKHSFFKKARSNDYIARTILEGLPALGDRMKALKMKEQDMLAQKKIPDGQMEEMSQNEYKRGISGWDFNLEDMKAQASLIQDEDVETDCEKNIQHLSSSMSRCFPVSDTDDDDITHNRQFHRSATMPSTSIEIEKSDDETGLSGSMGNRVNSTDCCFPIRESERMQNQLQRFSNCGDGFATQGADDQSQNLLSKASKTSANGEEVDEAAECKVQQKGRFKVTSESVDLEKVPTGPILQKSQSMQVLSNNSAPCVPLPLDVTPSSNRAAGPLIPILHSVMQTNMIQRDAILTLMKQISSDTPGEGGVVSGETITVEKSLLEAVLERERGLLQEINDLQRRLLSAQEELLRQKSNNTQV